MISRIKKLLEILGLTESRILLNPSVREIMKEFKRDTCILRFVIDKNGDYYVGDANIYIHREIIKIMDIDSRYNNIGGFIKLKDNYFWLFRMHLEDMAVYYNLSTEENFNKNAMNYEFYDEIEGKIIDKFKRSKIYGNLKSMFPEVRVG